MNFSRRSLLVFGGAGMLGAAIPTTLSQLKKTEPTEWIVGEHGGEYGPGTDISAAFNNTLLKKGSRPGRVVVPYVNSVMYVDKNSLTIDSDVEIDFYNNHIKLQNGASKYLLRNETSGNTISGEIIIKNATFDGNKRGGQTRRYDQSIKDDQYGDIYHYKDNYPGFCLVFDRLETLIIENVKIIDPEGWAIAHFLCNTARFTNVEIMTQNGFGLNGDGITGVATRYVHITNLKGYTNDDMIGISTSRATVQGISIFNPRDGRDVESVMVENLRSLQSQQWWSFVGVGLYFSDEKQIKDINIDGIEGQFQKHIVRMGDYWSASSACGIDNVLISRVYSSTVIPASFDFYFFSGGVNQFSLIHSKIARRMDSLAGYYNGEENSLLCIEGGKIGAVKINEVDYISEFLSLEPERYNRIVLCQNNGEIDQIIFDIHIAADKSNNYCLLSKTHSSDTATTINVTNLLSNSEMLSFHHITDNPHITIGNVFNVRVSERLTDNSTITRVGGDAWIDGAVNLSHGFSQIPSWCAPQQVKIISCYNSAALQKRYVARINPDGKVNVLQLPQKVTSVIFDGAGWKCC